MSEIFAGVSVAVGVLLLVLGISLNLLTVPNALVLTGIVMAFLGAAVRWYAAIVPEEPPTSAETA